ncbi:MAG: DegQ family serine endoprotease [Desulfobacterales bacterium]|jgi:serine protease Do|nr:DegQ family serine endoprotease [Desulfobacterales bacterium]
MNIGIFSKISTAAALLALFGFTWAGGPIEAHAQAAGDASKQLVLPNFSALAKQVQPGVVNIRTVKTIKGGGPVFRHFFGPFDPRRPTPPFGEGMPGNEQRQRSLGSGFIMDAEGFIITNNHVVEDADQIKVRLADEREFDARIIGRDSKTDLALIKIDAKDLFPLRLGDSDRLEVGSWVLAVGSPFGLEQTVTAGIVSAKGRFIGAGPYDDFIQTDASINPGNSGGPLLNMNGEVVGINTAIVAQGQGIGFAIPVNLARDIAAQLKDHGSVTRGWMGVGIQDLTPELAEYYGIKNQKGVLVTQVFPDNPADKAGIKPKDVIVAVDGKPVATGRELSAAVAGFPVGKEIPVKLIRDGKELSVKVRIAERKEAEPTASEPAADPTDLGIRAMDLTPEAARRFGIDESEKGALVAAVQPGSKAEQAGLRQADVIKEVNRTPVQTTAELRAQLGKAKTGDTLQLLVKRGSSGFIVVKLTK